MLAGSVLSLALGIIGWRAGNGWYASLRSWTTITLSLVLIFVSGMGSLLTALSPEYKKLLQTVDSPDKKYTIHFYAINTGAMGPFGVLGELSGPLWFKKRIYFESKADQVQTEWINQHTVLINNHELNLLEKSP